MAVLYVSEYSGIGNFGTNGLGPWPATPALASQTVSITSSSVASTTFSANTRLVVLSTDAICSIKFSADGTSVSATAANLRLPANGTPTIWAVNPGATVAVITNT